MTKSAYDILGIPEDADENAVRRAYRRLARALHPDVSDRKDAADRMVEVNDAYALLSDKESRANYDAMRRSGLESAPSPRMAEGTAFVRHHITIVDLPSPVYSLDFNPSTSELALGCFDNTIRFASAKTGKSLGELTLDGGAVTAVRWANGRRLVACGVSERSLTIWKAQNRQLVDTITRREEWVSPTALSANADYLVAGSVHRSLVAIDTNSGQTLFARKRHDDAVTSVAISNDGNFVASGGNDQRVLLWDRKGNLQAQIGPLRAAIAPMAFSPDGSQLAVSLIDNGIRIFDLQTGNLRTTLWGHEKPIESLQYHPNGWLLGSASRDATVRLWSTIIGKQLHCLPGHSAPANSLSFSRNGSLIASAGLDKTCMIYRVEA